MEIPNDIKQPVMTCSPLIFDKVVAFDIIHQGSRTLEQLVLSKTGDPIVKNFNPCQVGQLERSELTVAYLLLTGKIEYSHICGKVLDFGCADGGMSYFFRINGADVTAVDIFEPAIKRIVAAKILPPEKAVAGDGIEYLKKQPDNTYDTVLAFLIDPNIMLDHSKFSAFYTEANRTLKPDGRIIIIADRMCAKIIEESVGRYMSSDQLFGYIFVGKKANYVLISKAHSQEKNSFFGFTTSSFKGSRSNAHPTGRSFNYEELFKIHGKLQK